MESTERETQKKEKKAKKKTKMKNSFMTQSINGRFAHFFLLHSLSSCYLWIPASGINQLCCTKTKEDEQNLFDHHHGRFSHPLQWRWGKMNCVAMCIEADRGIRDGEIFSHLDLQHGCVCVCKCVCVGLKRNLFKLPLVKNQRKVHGKRSKSKNPFCSFALSLSVSYTASLVYCEACAACYIHIHSANF